VNAQAQHSVVLKLKPGEEMLVRLQSRYRSKVKVTGVTAAGTVL